MGTGLEGAVGRVTFRFQGGVPAHRRVENIFDGRLWWYLRI